LVVGAFFLLFCSGCGKDHAENKGTDNDYIRAPEETGNPIVIPPGDLLPTKQNSSWTWDVTVVRRVGTGSEAHAELVSKETEQVVITGQREMNHLDCTVFEIRKNGKPFREEVFATTKDGLIQVAAGLNDKVILAPPLPLVHFPMKDGQALSWTGVLEYRQSATPGTGFSRVSGREKVKTPLGEFPCWRVDTVITTTIQGQQAPFPVSRWFSPGIGMVRQRLYLRDLLVEKVLRAYQRG
jgi:hypothetical protein